MELMNYRLGLDLGSTTTKAVLLDAAGQVLGTRLAPTGADGVGVAARLRAELLAEYSFAGVAVAATGYGRAAAGDVGRRITEITCQARGVRHLHPDARTLIDLGGQDAKAIYLDEAGQVEDFVLNDRCAAGTGRFLEVLAQRLGRTPGELSALVPPAAVPPITATCAVFAESEAVGLLAGGQSAEAVLAGVMRASARRVAALLSRPRISEPIYFCGGGALNENLRRELASALGRPVLIAQHPQLTAALGAALLA